MACNAPSQSRVHAGNKMAIKCQHVHRFGSLCGLCGDPTFADNSLLIFCANVSDKQVIWISLGIYEAIDFNSAKVL